MGQIYEYVYIMPQRFFSTMALERCAGSFESWKKGRCSIV